MWLKCGCCRGALPRVFCQTPWWRCNVDCESGVHRGRRAMPEWDSKLFAHRSPRRCGWHCFRGRGFLPMGNGPAPHSARRPRAAAEAPSKPGSRKEKAKRATGGPPAGYWPWMARTSLEVSKRNCMRRVRAEDMHSSMCRCSVKPVTSNQIWCAAQ